jgi:hypothetical protein
MMYEFIEREHQRTAENRVYDIRHYGTGAVIGWVDQEKNYAPHVRIMDTRHSLDKKAMLEAIQKQLKTDGSFFLLSDLITCADVDTVTIFDLKSHAERLQTEIKGLQRDADAFLTLRDEKLQGIKDLQKQTEEVLKQIQALSLVSNKTEEKKP